MKRYLAMISLFVYSRFKKDIELSKFHTALLFLEAYIIILESMRDDTSAKTLWMSASFIIL